MGIKFGIFILIFTLPFLVVAKKEVRIDLEPVFQIGDEDIFFQSITSICEDKEQNSFVLDRKAHKVYKFSPQGKLLLTFGQRGQGPGDLSYPHFITVSGKNQVVVCEDMQFVSFFTRAGTFIRRIKIPKGLEPTYIAQNLYYAWQWQPKHKQQILIDSKGQILKRLFSISKDSFSIAVPDETGRMMMPSFFSATYTPRFLFATNGNLTAVAVSNQNKILILDGRGSSIHQFETSLSAAPIKASERKRLIEDINDTRRLPKMAKQAFIKKIPPFKNHLQQFLINDHTLFVFGMMEIPGQETSVIPVEIFSLKDGTEGNGTVPEVPSYISNTAFYAIGEDEDGWLFKKFSFFIKSN